LGFEGRPRNGAATASLCVIEMPVDFRSYSAVSGVDSTSLRTLSQRRCASHVRSSMVRLAKSKLSIQLAMVVSVISVTLAARTWRKRRATSE
jgi:hypothetical protein